MSSPSCWTGYAGQPSHLRSHMPPASSKKSPPSTAGAEREKKPTPRGQTAPNTWPRLRTPLTAGTTAILASSDRCRSTDAPHHCHFGGVEPLSLYTAARLGVAALPRRRDPPQPSLAPGLGDGLPSSIRVELTSLCRAQLRTRRAAWSASPGRTVLGAQLRTRHCAANAFSMRKRTSGSRSGSVANRMRRCTSSPRRAAPVWWGANVHGGSCSQCPQRAAVIAAPGAAVSAPGSIVRTAS